MTLAQHSVALIAPLCITTFGIVPGQESPVKMSSHVVQGTREIHVSTQGNDKNDGSAAKPVASLKIARTARGTTIVIHGGTYRLERRLELTHEDECVEFSAADRQWLAAPSKESYCSLTRGVALVSSYRRWQRD